MPAATKAIKTVRCPLCKGDHEVKLTKNGKPFLWCENWHQAVFFRGEGARFAPKAPGAPQAVRHRVAPDLEEEGPDDLEEVSRRHEETDNSLEEDEDEEDLE